MNTYIDKSKILIALLFFCFALSANAQKDTYLKFEKLDAGENFNLIRSIWRDSKEYLWIGNDGTGLARNDGYQTIKYMHDKADSTTLSSDAVLCIYEDRKKNLWIGTRDGLNLFDPDTENFTVFKHNPSDKKSISDNTINAIVEDDNGDLWIATNNGLNHWNAKTKSFECFLLNSDKNKKISSLAFDNVGTLWLCSFDRGILNFNKKTASFQIFDDKTINFGDNVHKKIFIEDDIIWIGTMGNGLIKFNKKNTSFYQINALGDGTGTNGNMIFDIISYDKRYLFFGVDQGGINRYNKFNGKFDYIFSDKTNKYGLTNNGIYCFHKDKEGILWVGTSRGGVNYSNPKKQRFKTYRHNGSNPNTISHNIIGAFYEDVDGIIWIGTDGGGLSRYNKKTNSYKHYKHDPNDPNSISGDVIRCIREDKDHNLWIGTWDFGMNKFDKHTEIFERFMLDENNNKSISSRVVWSIYIDQDNILWLGSYTGGIDLFKQGEGVIKRYSPNETTMGTPNPNGVHLITEDSKKNIWICAKNGLYRYNSTDKSFTLFDNFPDKSIFAFCYDLEGNIWVGTEREGVYACKPDGKIIKAYTIKNGLTDNHIVGLQTDNAGNIWVSTNNGLNKIDLKTKKIRNYTEEDGLQGSQFFAQSYLKTRDGEMYFGGTNGFNSFNPKKMKDNEHIPPVYINEFLIFNKPVSISKKGVLTKHISETKHITLTWKQSVITFGFTAINFTYPNKNSYAYMMKGFEEDWNYTNSDRRYASYTNLPAGEYIFTVKASNNDGQWNKEGQSIKITILPPWWETRWFRFLLAIFILGSGFGFYIRRMHQMKAQQRILEQRVEERTQDLQEANAILEESKEEIKQQNEKLASQKGVLEVNNNVLESQKNELLIKNIEIERQKDTIHTLSEFGQKITSTLNMTAINHMVYSHISSIMNATAFGIGIYNEKKQIIEFHDFIENNAKAPNFIRKLSNENSFTVYCIKNQKEIFINDIEKEYVNYFSGFPKNQTKLMQQSAMHIPITVKNKKIGTLTVSSSEKNAYTSSDLTSLQTITSYLAIALDNANAYQIVEHQNKNIKDSINYAKTIQQTILPIKNNMDRLFNNFVLFKPKDIVSGDFYWLYEAKDLVTNDSSTLFIAAIDCTGHGVPGAFMSLIGSRLLNEIVAQKNIYDPCEILSEMHSGIIAALKQNYLENDDGMDVSLCKIEKNITTGKTKKLIYSGAKRPLYQYSQSKEEVLRIKGSLNSIGGGNYVEEHPYVNIEIYFEENDMIYLTSDGYIDQNNVNRKNLGTNLFYDIIKRNHEKDLETQKLVFEKELKLFMGNESQRDDITVIGIRL